MARVLYWYLAVVFLHVRVLRGNDVLCVRSCNKPSLRLRTATFEGCSLLEDVSALANLPNLEELDLSGCSNLENIAALGECTSLHILNISSCGVLKQLCRCAVPRVQNVLIFFILRFDGERF